MNMYTRSRQNQGYGNVRNSNSSTISGSYAVPVSVYNTQGSYQPSQSSSNQQSDYKQGSIQGSKSQQQQQQQSTQMAATTPTRPLQQLKPQITSQQQLHQQSLQRQSQISQLQQQPQLVQQQQQSQQQQQASNPPALPQRLKPILKQNMALSSSSVTQTTPAQPSVSPPAPAPTAVSNNIDIKDDSINTETTDIDAQEQPRWRRKIPGFKVNKRLKRLRMNQRLRKTLQPKNAIMVLNEMKAGCQFTFPETQGPMSNSLYLVHAELDGKTYVGQGLSKPLARQNAAENALKALLLEKMTAASMKARIDAESDGQANQSPDIKDENNDEIIPMDTNTENDEIPWSSLASFALYKLFLEWHNQGTSVPVPRPGLPTIKGAKKDANAPKTPVQKELPPNPTNIHPVMLLNQMRPGLTYVELNRIGNPPNTMFTLAVEIDGTEYSGTAKNKKDAKKAAAKAALLTLYGLTYPDETKPENMVIA